MRKRIALIGVFCLSVLLALHLARAVRADSDRAYQDYLYQFDQYRQKYTEFQVAKNEYQKFNTLTSQTDALNKTKAMLTQRDQLLRAYLLLLKERVAESSSMIPTDQELYRTLINNEVSFLDSHSLLIPAVQSLDDAVKVSADLEKHYGILQISMRQIIVGLSLAQLKAFGDAYNDALLNAKNIISSSGNQFPIEKQATIDRWVLQITNKQTLFLQKSDQIRSANTTMRAMDLRDLDSKFADIMRTVTNARQDLIEGTSYLNELSQALKYKD